MPYHQMHLSTVQQLAASQDAKVTVIGSVTESREIAIRHLDGAWHRLERLEHDSFADDGNGIGHFSRIEQAPARRGTALEGATLRSTMETDVLKWVRA